MARNSVEERRRKFAEEAAAEIGLKAEDFGLNVSELTSQRLRYRPLTLREFVGRVYPKYQWYRHCEVLADVLQRVADGELKRVLISMPPRHGKSQLATKIFPAYYLYRHSDKWVGVNSYAADLSYTFSRAARECYQDSGGKLRADASAVKHWETVEGGGFWAAGVGGPITGKGFSLGIIDDPLKNHEEAFSDNIRTKQQDWYGSTFYTRAEADAAIVVIQTRWHENDLTGWLLSQEGEDDEPECWHVVNFEAIKEESEREFPVSCTVEPDWRQPGEALCPERYDLKRLRKIAKRIASYFWNALYQQRPTSADGDVFNIDWFCYYAQLPATFEMLVLSVDATFKESKTSDFVVVQLWGIAWPNLYLIDQVRDRMGFTKTKEAIVALCSRWKPIYGEANAKLIEDKANGSAIIEELKREMPGIIAIEPEGGKLARAQAASPYYEGKNIWLPSGTGWTKDYVAEHIAFPRGANDDQVDGSTQLVNWVARKYTIKTMSPDFGF